MAAEVTQVSNRDVIIAGFQQQYQWVLSSRCVDNNIKRTCGAVYTAKLSCDNNAEVFEGHLGVQGRAGQGRAGASVYLYVGVTIDAVDNQVVHIVCGLQHCQKGVGSMPCFTLILKSCNTCCFGCHVA